MGVMMIIRHLGLQPYDIVWESMKQFTQTRDKTTPDELWLLEHPAIYTQGQAGKPEHLLNAHQIPVIQSDRGGQITYHGPGQLVAYVLMDIQRRQLSIRSLVCQLEQLLIQLLSDYKIQAQTQCGAPGVYVEDKKISSIGLRVKKGCTYHGIALNVAMDLSPFSGINPCGFKQLEMTEIRSYQPKVQLDEVSQRFAHHFSSHFGQ